MSVPYVGPEAAELVVEWERRFQSLMPAAGVLFVSVSAIPAEAGLCSTFEVRLGMSRIYEESTGLSLIKHVLAEEMASGRYEIKGAVYRGARCAGEPSSRAGGAHPTQA